jgi:SAM-dependent methyltransferase
MQKATKKWYANWFDTDFYHVLYKDRDDNDAQLFMDNITHYLNLPENGSILDLACGRGRHAVYLNSLGFNVTGADLSENSIAFAKQFENENLQFKVHDMSKPFGQTFDAVFNLFTSFGYFDDDADNLNTLKAIKTNLNEFGFGVIDFLNTSYVEANLVTENIKKVGNIEFHLKRYMQDGYIFKDINFNHQGEAYSFTERVKALTLQDFEIYFKEANINLLSIFGDYKLNKFNKDSSERLIMVFK